MLCGREIGPIRLLRDNEFCTSAHRELYKERLNKALGQAEVAQLRASATADFNKQFSPVESCAAGASQARADLSPMKWSATAEMIEPGMPLDIDEVAGARPKTIPFRPADRRFQPALNQLFPAEGAHAAAIRLPETLGLEPVKETKVAPEDRFANQVPGEADFAALEYYCQRVATATAMAREWTWRPPGCAMPKFAMPLAGEKLEDLAAIKQAPAVFFAPIKPAPLSRAQMRMMMLAAAGVLLATMVGFGTRFATRIGTETPDVKRDAAASLGKPGGPFERVRRAIADRAAMELSDGFNHGMEAWGHAGSLPPGWTRRSEGYMQTGQLAIFQPSVQFTDYRMEFFGQIESKSMGWAVRARDPKNYYAMKFTVIQPGLRPVIAIVHYTVTNGHAGRPIETPLMEVMVHNDTAYHVGVTVKGNLIVTAIEGQEVDRWIEDRIPNGGVGFYSDAGERARLYWMKVSRNEDFLGKVCAYLSGSADPSRNFALLLPPGWKNGKRNVAAYSYGD